MEPTNRIYHNPPHLYQVLHIGACLSVYTGYIGQIVCGSLVRFSWCRADLVDSWGLNHLMFLISVILKSLLEVVLQEILSAYLSNFIITWLPKACWNPNSGIKKLCLLSFLPLFSLYLCSPTQVFDGVLLKNWPQGGGKNVGQMLN